MFEQHCSLVRMLDVSDTILCINTVMQQKGLREFTLDLPEEMCKFLAAPGRFIFPGWWECTHTTYLDRNSAKEDKTRHALRFWINYRPTL